MSEQFKLLIEQTLNSELIYYNIVVDENKIFTLSKKVIFFQKIILDYCSNENR